MNMFYKGLFLLAGFAVCMLGLQAMDIMIDTCLMAAEYRRGSL